MRPVCEPKVMLFTMTELVQEELAKIRRPIKLYSTVFEKMSEKLSYVEHKIISVGLILRKYIETDLQCAYIICSYKY